jgi:hypothetical protein
VTIYIYTIFILFLARKLKKKPNKIEKLSRKKIALLLKRS